MARAIQVASVKASIGYVIVSSHTDARDGDTIRVYKEGLRAIASRAFPQGKNNICEAAVRPLAAGGGPPQTWVILPRLRKPDRSSLAQSFPSPAGSRPRQRNARTSTTASREAWRHGRA